jgi:MFS family permease
LVRLFAASAAADFAHYLIHTAVAFKALRLGADPLQLGALAAASTGAYALLVGLSGRASDRVPRVTLARASCIGVAAACLGLTLAGRVERMLLCMPLLGGSVAFFWPCVQASIADRSDAASLGRNLGRFNLSWSSGKGTGFLLGGVLVSLAGAETVLTLGCVAVAAIFFILPPPRAAADTGPIAALHSTPARDGNATAAVTQAGVEADAAAALAPTGAADVGARAVVFRRLAWLANGAAYGVVATLTYHYPRMVESHGWSARAFGLFLGGIYFTEMLAFAWLLRHSDWWRFRRASLFVPQLLIAAGVAALPLADAPRLAVTALVFGFGLATCYAASIEYSLLVHEARGRNAGVHETLIGIGSMVVPLAGGLLARAMGVAWAPYLVAAAAVLASLASQEILFRAGRHRAGRRLALSSERPDPDVVAPA